MLVACSAVGGLVGLLWVMVVSLEQFSAVSNGLEHLSPGMNCSKLSSDPSRAGARGLESDFLAQAQEQPQCKSPSK